MGFETGLRYSAKQYGIEWLVDEAIKKVEAVMPQTDYNKHTYAAAVVTTYQDMLQKYLADPMRYDE